MNKSYICGCNPVDIRRSFDWSFFIGLYFKELENMKWKGPNVKPLKKSKPINPTLYSRPKFVQFYTHCNRRRNVEVVAGGRRKPEIGSGEARNEVIPYHPSHPQRSYRGQNLFQGQSTGPHSGCDLLPELCPNEVRWSHFYSCTLCCIEETNCHYWEEAD